jgi:hypothetical protein
MVTIEDGTMDPFIMIIMVPLMATYNEQMRDNGLLYNDIWEPMVL